MNARRIMALSMTAVAISLSTGVAVEAQVAPSNRTIAGRHVDPERPTITAGKQRANRDEGGIAAVTTLLNECFEGFALGTLNGQNGWATGGTAATTVVGGSLIEGVQSVNIALGIGTTVSGGDSPDFGPLPEDRYISIFRGRLSSIAGSATDAMEFRSIDITNNTFTSRIRVTGTGAIEVRNLISETPVTFAWSPTGQSVAANVPFTIRLEYDQNLDAGQGFDNGRARYYLNNNTTPLFTANGTGGIQTELLEVVKTDQMAAVNFDCLNLGRLPGSCEADVAGFNGQVEVLDLLAVINTWGPCPAPPGLCDANIVPNAPGPQAVDVVDLLAVINTWGHCPFPTGACCVGTSCQALTFNACVAANGTAYFGNDTTCAGVACTAVGSDECATATPITLPFTETVTVAVFTTNNTSDPDTTCELGGGGPFIKIGGWWYSWTSPASGVSSITVATCTTATDNDSVVSVYSGACGTGPTTGWTQVGCDDDTCNNPAVNDPLFGNATATVPVTPNTTYRIFIDNYSGGDFGPSVTVTITANP